MIAILSIRCRFEWLFRRWKVKLICFDREQYRPESDYCEVPCTIRKVAKSPRLR